MALRPVITALAIVSCGCTATTRDVFPALAAAKRLPLEICQIDGTDEPLLCGTFRVPENRNENTSRTIDISIVVIPSVNENAERLAWIEHPGGPRYSTIATARYFAEGGWLEAFRQNIDIVLVDVRGLHESGPLYCDALSYPRILTRYYPPEKVRACREELETQVDLSQYSTINAIEDYEDIRQWLGYSKWNVGGWSFGSRFMLTYVHLYPESVRSVSLNVPAILNFRRPLDYARFGQQAFDGLVDECSNDAACSAAFPTFATDLYSTLERLEEHPEPIQFVDPVTGAKQDRLLTRNIFAEIVWIALLSVEETRNIPFLLHHAARGNFEPFVDFAVPKTAPVPEPEGHYFSVVCSEETAQLSMKEAEYAARDTFVGSYIAKDYIEACQAWGAAESSRHPIEPGVFDIPALIITGENDPVNAPEYGDINAKHFANPLHITVPRMAHGASGMENAHCLTDMVTAFVEQGSTKGLDTSCVKTMKPKPFRLGD